MRAPYKPAALIFLLALLTPATVQLFSDRAQISVAEKRTLERLPAWPTGWTEWNAVSGKLDRFLRDHFGLREPLSTGWNLFKYALRHTPGVAVGRDGWLYHPQHWHSKYGARTCGPLSAEALSLVERLDRFAAHAADRGVRVLFTIAPDKETVYPEYMPRPAAAGRCDVFAEVAESLRGLSHLKTLDLRSPLEAWKKKELVYFRTDSHWNDIGGWQVARILLEGTCVAGGACPRLRQPSRWARTYRGDLAGLIGLGSVLTESYVALEISGGGGAGRTLHVVGDSFARSVLRFLAADESVAQVRWSAYGTGQMDFRQLLAARPDAILIVVVERALYDRELVGALAASFD